MKKEMYYVAMWGSIICSVASQNLVMSGMWIVLAIIYGVLTIRSVK